MKSDSNRARGFASEFTNFWRFSAFDLCERKDHLFVGRKFTHAMIKDFTRLYGLERHSFLLETQPLQSILAELRKRNLSAKSLLGAYMIKRCIGRDAREPVFERTLHRIEFFEISPSLHIDFLRDVLHPTTVAFVSGKDREDAILITFD